MPAETAVRVIGESLTVRAPAKLNLSLAVLARRPDGYHEIESLMVPVSLHDTLVVRVRSEGGRLPDAVFSFRCGDPQYAYWLARYDQLTAG
jgi:hypothetical protein